MKSYPIVKSPKSPVLYPTDKDDAEEPITVSSINNRKEYQFEADPQNMLNSDPQSPYKSKRTFHSYNNEDAYSLVSSVQDQHKHRKYNTSEELQTFKLKYNLEPSNRSEIIENNTQLVPDQKIPGPGQNTISVDSSEVFFDSDSTRNEMVVNNLVISSDYFLNRAHETVLDTNSMNGSKTYFKMIKISIKSLLLLIRKYSKCLNPYLELIIYFKLARIYFIETENINRADDYVNKAISIATRNNLIKVKFICEFLAAQILEKSNPKLSLNYINERISNFKMIGLHSLGSLFALLKIDNLLSQDPNTGLIVLQSLCQDPQIDNTTRALCFIYQSNLHLYRGSPKHSLELLNHAEKLMYGHEENYPIQLQAILFLLKYSVYIHTDDSAGSKDVMQFISNFILTEQLKHWNSWKEDGTFKIKIDIPSSNGLNSDLSYRVTWLNSDEFVIMFYFLTGVHFLPEIYNKKYKSKKVFQKCLQILDNQLHELRGMGNTERCFPLNQLTKKIIRLSFIRYYINYYQVWMNFLDKNFTNIDPLNEFLENYHNSKFSDEELCYYKLLIPNIFYLFGIFFQYKGDLKAAKYYYMRVRSFTLYEQEPSNTIEYSSILQSSLGVGGETFQSKGQFSELYIYSTLHLVMLTEFEVYQITKSSHTNIINDRDDTYRFRSHLYLDLTKIFDQKDKKTSNSFNMNLAGSSQTLIITYNLLLSIYDNNYSGSGKVNAESSEYPQILYDAMKGSNSMHSFPYLISLIHYVTYLLSTSLADKELALKMCLSLVSMENCSDNERIVNLFILKDYSLQLHEEGDYDKGSLIETQLRYLHDSLESKFQLINLNNKDNSNHLA